MIAIINYGSGNVRAIGNIYDRLNIQYQIVDSVSSLSTETSKIILPGVGAFDETMSMLLRSGFREKLDELVLEKNIPVLGICVGMQILSGGSEEGGLEGLNWIPGLVKMIPKDFLKDKPKLPHLGWNSVEIKKDSPIMAGVDAYEGFYFIHSYYFECAHEEDVLTTTYYGQHFTSSINKGLIFGTQFHPEKSHGNGIAVLKNFANL
nr:imidazole glycerol phosphate synthase subunit HisH [uncultured Sediminibacterium sp.]